MQVYGEVGRQLGLYCLTPLSTIFQLYRDGSVLLMEEYGVPAENHRPAANTPLNMQDSNSQH